MVLIGINNWLQSLLRLTQWVFRLCVFSATVVWLEMPAITDNLALLAEHLIHEYQILRRLGQPHLFSPHINNGIEPREVDLLYPN